MILEVVYAAVTEMRGRGPLFQKAMTEASGRKSAASIEAEADSIVKAAGKTLERASEEVAESDEDRRKSKKEHKHKHKSKRSKKEKTKDN